MNRGKVPRFLIAVQSGGRLGEDDIVRFEALYERDREPAAPAGVHGGDAGRLHDAARNV